MKIVVGIPGVDSDGKWVNYVNYVGLLAMIVDLVAPHPRSKGPSWLVRIQGLTDNVPRCSMILFDFQI